MQTENQRINRDSPIISLRTSLTEIKSLLERHERIQARFPFKIEKTRGQKACDAIERKTTVPDRSSTYSLSPKSKP